MLLDPDLLASVVSAHRAQGLDLLELFAEQTVTSAMVLKDGRIADATSGREIGVGIRMRRGGSFVYSHANDIAPAAVLDVARKAASLAAGLPSSDDAAPRRTSAAGTVPVTGASGGEGAARDATAACFGERAHQAALLLSVPDLVAEGGGVTSVTAVIRNEHRVRDIANSLGARASGTDTRRRLAITVALGPSTSPASARASVAVNAPGAGLGEEAVREAVHEAVRRARARVGVSPAPTGEMPVVLAAGTGAVLIHEACGHGLEGDHLSRRSSAFQDLLGRRVGPSDLHIVDDGGLSGAWGSSEFDDEGHRTARTPLVENGVLVGYMWDLAHLPVPHEAVPVNGRRQNYQCPPLPRMTNTLVLPGSVAPGDIVADTVRGIYVARLGSGRVNTATGDFVFAATEAYAIRRGRLCEPLADCSLIGNGPDVLRGIDAIGTDFAMGPPGSCGKDGQTVPVGYGQPTLRVRTGLRIGGTKA
ncbi:TldD/PmbA family protein [Streptomyces sp. WAC07149]|uniref:TldD/PmbA family protein n=1 Tax=Streptomyces sp. WAC07149 TaxID=2487425 RepID=UPI000F787AC6|nr:TldD/PmbA family protein [Streptomyces sp. WAC07149]RST09011.1 TldD/PmbA family protein [Streptomyces sp. WAC07149]